MTFLKITISVNILKSYAVTQKKKKLVHSVSISLEIILDCFVFGYNVHRNIMDNKHWTNT